MFGKKSNCEKREKELDEREQSLNLREDIYREDRKELVELGEKINERKNTIILNYLTRNDDNGDK